MLLKLPSPYCTHFVRTVGATVGSCSCPPPCAETILAADYEGGGGVCGAVICMQLYTICIQIVYKLYTICMHGGVRKRPIVYNLYTIGTKAELYTIRIQFLVEVPDCIQIVYNSYTI